MGHRVITRWPHSQSRHSYLHEWFRRMKEPVPSGAPLRVLRVEPAPADVVLNKIELGRAGYDVSADVAGTRLEFVELTDANVYDIVLADYRLPGWTGMEALAFLRENELDVPFILVTGTMGDELAVDCLKLGAADYVLKGNLSRLRMAVPRAIEECRRRREVESSERRARAAGFALRESDERFRQLAENVAEIFFIMDVQACELLYINSSYERICGQTVQSVYDNPLSFLDSIMEDDVRAVKEIVAQAQRGERPAPLEFRIRRPDGSERFISSQAAPVRNDEGDVYRIVGVAHDVTERMRKQAAAGKSASR